VTTHAIFVPGLPVTQGSGKAITSRSTGRAMYLHSNAKALRQFRQALKRAWTSAYPTAEPATGPLQLSVTQIIARPASHYGTGRNSGLLKAKAPGYPDKRPDLDKILRAVGDACTDAGIWVDDAQVIKVTAKKEYALQLETPGVYIAIAPFPTNEEHL